MYFYEVLQDIMNEKSLSIPDVARLTGLADSTIRSILTRKTKTVALEVAFKMSKGLNVSLERLNGEEPEQSLCINQEEESLVIAYRNHPEAQYAVKKLLDISNQN